MKTALIFGATGGIGSATVNQFNHSYSVVGVTRDQLNLRSDSIGEAIGSLLKQVDPDLVINCAGVLEGDFAEIFAVNVASCWHIIQYYLQQTEMPKPVTILLVGSTTYSGGRRNYPLYSASKAALHNLVQGCQEAIGNRAITLSLLHPARVQTRMSECLPKTGNELTAAQVASELLSMSTQPSQIKELR
jgi:short-subunit dehydrogenase